MNNKNNPTHSFDIRAKEWDLKPERVELASAVADAIIANLSLNKNMVAIDYGAGTGLVTLKLVPCVKRITAADSSKGMLEVLEDKLKNSNIDNVDILYWDIEKDDLPALKFDLIVSSMTLHHLKDTKKVIRRFFNALKNGGQIGIADLDKEEGDFHSDNADVEHFGFDREELKKIFAEAEFSSVNVTTAYTRKKRIKSGEEKNFPVFLMTGKK